MRKLDLQLARQHRRRAIRFIVIGGGLSLVSMMILRFGFGYEPEPALLPAVIGQIGAGWHLSQQARWQGRNPWLMGLIGGSTLGGALMVYYWLSD